MFNYLFINLSNDFYQRFLSNYQRWANLCQHSSIRFKLFCPSVKILKLNCIVKLGSKKSLIDRL